uniref:Uncharacterized protein n=1 Tax=Cucumis melo TaxID=3656 RepID=A0A9I9E3T3_CUCME
HGWFIIFRRTRAAAICRQRTRHDAAVGTEAAGRSRSCLRPKEIG